MKFFLSSLGLGFGGSVNAFPVLLFLQRAEPALDAAHKFIRLSMFGRTGVTD
jgi:hypothetical protein